MSGIYSQLGLAKEVSAALPSVTSVVFAAAQPNTGTVTFGTSHGLRVGDLVTFAGATPSAWNATWVVYSVTSATVIVISLGTTVTTSTTIQPTATASGFGLTTTPSRFFELVSETVKADFGRVESKALTAGRYVGRADRWAPANKGAGGDIVMEVTSRGFAYFLSLLMGTVVTTGPTDTVAYTHTATIGALLGQSATIQVGRPLTSPAGVVIPFTYVGAKIVSWELSNDVDGILQLKISIACRNELRNVNLAVVSYAAASEMFTFLGGTLTYNAIALATVKKFSLQVNNGLGAAADRRFIDGSGLPNEMLQNNWRDVTWSADLEFYTLTEYNRYVSATAAGGQAQLVAKWQAPTIIGASTNPSLTATMPNARTDGATPTVGGPSLLTYTLNGEANNTAASSDDALTLAYVTLDSTP